MTARSDLPPDAGGADALLLDAKPPKGATRPGGNAVAFDWSLLAGWTAPYPWILAGGLTPDNVADAIAVTGAPCVDVSSGVEVGPGRKCPALIRGFVAAVRTTRSLNGRSC
jgi:phosphoribosylanthranilate isomerase